MIVPADPLSKMKNITLENIKIYYKIITKGMVKGDQYMNKNGFYDAKRIFKDNIPYTFDNQRTLFLLDILWNI